MADSSAQESSYDELAYPGQPVPQSHLSRLAAVGLLFGMRPPAVDGCRVLELGCASGANLMPMADAYPQSTFVGIDYSRGQIDVGRETVSSLGLKNVTLERQDIARLDADLGEFDYIICHGVFSWVGHPLQETILDVCRARLAPQGIAYISYNAYPGWHLRKIIRQAMLVSAGQGTIEQRVGARAGCSTFWRSPSPAIRARMRGC